MKGRLQKKSRTPLTETRRKKENIKQVKSYKTKLFKNKKTRRGKRNSAKTFSKSLRLMGVNSAGLKCKMMTFKKVISELQPSIFFVEETKYKDIGKFKFSTYVVFELLRKNRDGGGLAIGCVQELKPVMVRDGGESVEALSIDIFVQQMKIRC